MNSKSVKSNDSAPSQSFHSKRKYIILYESDNFSCIVFSAYKWAHVRRFRAGSSAVDRTEN